MPFYIYHSISEKGEIAKHTGHFDDLVALDRFLFSRNEWLYKSFALPDMFAGLAKRTGGKVKPLLIAEFCNNMSLYLAGGISIHSALEDMVATAKIPAFKQALDDILRSLNDGQLLSEAIRMTGIFPNIVVRMTKIGEETGTMDRMMRDAGTHIERIEGIKSATKRALIYPSFTLITISGAFIFWIVFVLPQLVELFTNMGTDLPITTRLLIAGSDFLFANWLIILVSLVLLPTLFTLARRNRVFRLYTDRGLWHAPVVGTIIRGSETAFYFQYLSLMIHSGVLISDALKTTGESLSNTFFMDKIKGINDSIRGGISLFDSFMATSIFELVACRMVGIGEQTGSLENQMDKLAEIYYERVQALVETIGKVLEPLILGVAGAMFIFFIIALMGPLYGMIGNLGI